MHAKEEHEQRCALVTKASRLAFLAAGDTSLQVEPPSVDSQILLLRGTATIVFPLHDTATPYHHLPAGAASTLWNAPPALVLNQIFPLNATAAITLKSAEQLIPCHMRLPAARRTTNARYQIINGSFQAV